MKIVIKNDKGEVLEEENCILFAGCIAEEDGVMSISKSSKDIEKGKLINVIKALDYTVRSLWEAIEESEEKEG